MHIINPKTFPYLWFHVIALEYRIENIGLGIIINVGLFSLRDCENWKWENMCLNTMLSFAFSFVRLRLF